MSKDLPEKKPTDARFGAGQWWLLTLVLVLGWVAAVFFGNMLFSDSGSKSLPYQEQSLDFSEQLEPIKFPAPEGALELDRTPFVLEGDYQSQCGPVKEETQMRLRCQFTDVVKNPKYNYCSVNFPNAAVVSLSQAGATADCDGYGDVGANAVDVKAGQAIDYGVLACETSESSVQCWSTATGVGFYMDSEGWRPYWR